MRGHVVLRTDIHAAFERLSGGDRPFHFTGDLRVASSSSPDELRAGDKGGGATRSAPPPIYLGLDQDSSRLPWARGYFGMPHPEVGTHGLSSWVAPNGLPDPGRVMEGVEEFIQSQALAHGVTHVWSEAVYHGENKLVVERLLTIRAALQHACFKANIVHREATPAEWRTHFFDTARAPSHLNEIERRAWFKQRAVDTCKWRKWPISGEHEAEACGILNYALCREYPTYDVAWLPLMDTGRDLR